MKRILVLACVVAFVCAATANAAVKEGDTELSLYGTYQSINYEDNGTDEMTIATIGFGRFLTNELELSVTGLGMWSEDTDIYGIGGSAKYHFMTDTSTVPYAGIQGLFVVVDSGDSDNGFLWGPLAGIKFFVNETTSLFVEYQYQLYSSSGDTGHQILGGIAFKW